MVSVKKEFVEPILVKYEEKLDEVTKTPVAGSCPEDQVLP